MYNEKSKLTILILYKDYNKISLDMLFSLFNKVTFLFFISCILSYSNLFAGGSSGGGGGCGIFCEPCYQKVVNVCSGLVSCDSYISQDKCYNIFKQTFIDQKFISMELFGYEYYGSTFLDSRCHSCTQQTYNYPTMEEIRKKDFTKNPDFFKVSFDMFPKDGSYHILPDNIVKSLKSHISCKDDTSRYILKKAYTEKKSSENVLIPYCKKWVIGISNNYIQSTFGDGSVELNPNTDIKILCKETDTVKHINIDTSDTISDYINLNSSIKLYDGFVCRDGFHQFKYFSSNFTYDFSTTPPRKIGFCKVPLKNAVKHDKECAFLVKKEYRWLNTKRNCGNLLGCNISGEHDRFECYEKGTKEHYELCKKMYWMSGQTKCKNSRKACTYIYDKVEKCKIEERKKCKTEKNKEINNRYEECNKHNNCKYFENIIEKQECSTNESKLELCKKNHNSWGSTCSNLERVVEDCNRYKKDLKQCNIINEQCKKDQLNNAKKNYDNCINLISNSNGHQEGICEDEKLYEYRKAYTGCYFDDSIYSYEKIDDVVKYEVNICQKPIFLDSVKNISVEKIYDPNLVIKH